MLRIAVDTGGTFTDFVVQDSDGSRTFKVKSTPADPARALIQGLAEITGPFELLHGTTVATNALLEGKLAKTAFVTNSGFRDILFLARQTRPELYSFEPRLPQPPVERNDCYSVTGRMHPDGSELTPLKESELDDLSNYEAVAVCLLFAYANGEHERRIAAELERRPGSPFVSLSHRVSPEFREYERAMATVVNAAVAPIMREYLEKLRRNTSASKLMIMSSSGGLIGVDDAMDTPIRSITSGPAGGVVATAQLGRRYGLRRLIAFDMGGTSTDVALVSGGPAYTSLAEIAGLPIRLRRVDIHSIGCGGGSIAYLDQAGALRVGPESAGADPGPALYGLGEALTVTDANFLLGRLRIERFAERDTLALDPTRLNLVASAFATRLACTVEDCAERIVERAEAHMVCALRAVSSARGSGPEDCTLVAYGGSGALHACAIAEELRMSEVIVPVGAGVFSAVGLLAAPRIWEESGSVLGRTVEWDRVYHDLEAKARSHVGEPVELVHRTADMRYQGQSHEIEVPAGQSLDGAIEAFHGEHATRFKVAFRGKPVEWVTARVRVESAPGQSAVYADDHAIQPMQAIQPIREPTRIRWRGEWVEGTVVDRESVQRQDGPAVILDDGCTILVPLGWAAERLFDGALRLHRAQG
ncbi:MAG: hydantoinase/oxoprolinase family protein [Fimbriimonadales bacterium]